MVETTTVVKVGGLLTSSSIITNMIIFQDRFYLFLALLGACISLAGLLHEIWKEDSVKNPTVTTVAAEMIKALVLGAVLTPMFFMFYITAGDKVFYTILNSVFSSNIEEEMFDSFWFLASLLTSWYIVPVWAWILKGFVKIGKRFFG